MEGGRVSIFAFAALAAGFAAIEARPRAAAAFETDAPIVNPARAERNWIMNCRGCHGVHAEGSPGGAPPMRGVIDGFIRTEQGRAYLGRVPGVANAPLSDDDLSDVLNWMLSTFLCEAPPTDFKYFDASEVGALRRDILITGAASARSALLASTALNATPADTARSGACDDADSNHDY